MRRIVHIITSLLLLLGVTMCAKDDPSGQSPEDDSQQSSSSPYITQIFDYCPAPGQFVNKLPAYEEGDTQESMNGKVLSMIGDNSRQTITLGGYGGYVTIGFDHRIENVDGVCDFRVIGNAYYSTQSSGAEGGSCEAGIIMVSCDDNENGLPDDEWYEIAGSAHQDVTQELWYDSALLSGNDVEFYFNNFEITYTRPSTEELESSDISWSDNKGNIGSIARNAFNTQSYFPLWIEGDLTLSGSRLPENGVLEESVYVLYKFEWGYADNDTNVTDGSAIDISWAVDGDGNSVDLEGVDFIRVYNGVNQANGSLGESSTEVLGVEDLHLLDVVVESNR